MRQPTKRAIPAHSGFTIVELLVATAVTAVLIGLMVTMTSGVLTAWNRTSGTLTANNQAKIVLDQVGQDLQAAFFRYDSSTPNGALLAVEILDTWPSEGDDRHRVAKLEDDRGWITPDSPGQSGIIKPTRSEDDRSLKLDDNDLAECRYGFGGAWLRLFSNNVSGTAGEDNTIPAAISYQIVRRHITSPTAPGTPNPAEVRYMLYRSEVDGRNGPIRYGYDLATATVLPRPPDSGPGLRSPPETTPDHYADSTASGGLINPSDRDIIANNIIDFGVRLYVRGAGALVPVFPVDGSSKFNDDHNQYLADGSSNPFPDAADIMVRVLTEEGARQIQHLEAGRTYRNVTNDSERRQLWWNIAEENSRVFTRRVFLNARPY